MIISSRHRALLLRLAANPNAYPWSVENQSKLEGTDKDRDPANLPAQTITKLKIRKDIYNRNKEKNMSLNMLQSVQVQESMGDRTEKEEEGPTKGKPTNADKERKK